MILLPGDQACKSYLNKILILQKRALRLLYFADWHDHAIPLFLKANVLPIAFLYYESVSTLIHHINNVVERFQGLIFPVFLGLPVVLLSLAFSPLRAILMNL